MVIEVAKRRMMLLVKIAESKIFMFLIKHDTPNVFYDTNQLLIIQYPPLVLGKKYGWNSFCVLMLYGYEYLIAAPPKVTILAYLELCLR